MNDYGEILVSELAIKSKSKKEVYDLISQEGKVFLPPMKDAHSKYLSQVICGEKKYLKCQEVKVSRVPHIKGLRTKEILQQSRRWFPVDQYLPEYEYNKLPNRDFLCSLINSICEKEFTEYISECMKKRVQLVVNIKRMTVKALPEFIKMFRSSNNVSIASGRSHYLLKRSGGRRWEQVKKEDAEMLKIEQERVAKLNIEMQRMREELEYQDSMKDELEHKIAVIEELKKRGLLDPDGMLTYFLC